MSRRKRRHCDSCGRWIAVLPNGRLQRHKRLLGASLGEWCVVDLMEALKASVEATKAARNEAWIDWLEDTT